MGITTAQSYTIAMICCALEIEFTGSTRFEASRFIARNLDAARKFESEDEALSHIQYEECGFI